MSLNNDQESSGNGIESQSTAVDDTEFFEGFSDSSSEADEGEIQSLDAPLNDDNLFFMTGNGSLISCKIKPVLGVQLINAFSNAQNPIHHSQALPQLQGVLQLPAVGPPALQAPTPRTSNVSAVGLPGPQAPSQSTSTTSRAQKPVTSNYPVIEKSSALAKKMSDIFEETKGSPYHRAWMANHDVSSEMLQGWSSKHKLDLLVRHGAVRSGDKLRIMYKSGDSEVARDGEVLGGSTASNSQIKIAPGLGGVIEKVRGPKDFVAAMNDKYAADYGASIGPVWKAVRVISSDETDYGTLFEVRQAYHFFTEERTQWGIRKAEESDEA